MALFTSPRQKFLYDLLIEKDQHLYDLYTVLEQNLPSGLSMGKIIDNTRKVIKKGKQPKFLNAEINETVVKIIRTEEILDVLMILLEESGLEKAAFVPKMIGPRSM